MAIRIEKITVKNLGPIVSFSEDLGAFNLIYSKNECGKTFLTEFILRCLFRNIKRWQFRERGSGRVALSGIEGDTVSEFLPDTGKKLEDFWESQQKGMPLSMAKLLVSKGGQPSIENSDEGIGKSLVKEVFSGISLLDKIDDDKKISRTIKSAEFSAGKISISSTGEGRQYKQLLDDMEKIDRLFSDIDAKYAVGIIDSYKSEAKMLKSLKDGLYRAKCHQAYTISQQIKKLAKAIEDKDEENLNDLYSDVTIYENKKNEYKNKKSQLAELKEKCRDYEWLKKVPPLYEKLSSGFVKKPKTIFIVTAGLFLIAAAIFSILDIPAAAVSFIAAAAALLYFYIYRLIKSLKAAGPSEEFNKLKASFKERTGRQLSDIAVLNAEMEAQQSSFEQFKLLEIQAGALKKELASLESKIQNKFYDFTGCTIPEGQWLGSYSSLRNEIRDLKDEIESMHKKQLELAVRETEYLEYDPGIKFSHEEFEEVSGRLEAVELEISQRNNQLSALKQVICNETADDITVEWEQLIENLKDKKNEKQQSLLETRSRIIAGIIVHGEISILRQEEDVKIEEGLKSESVLNPLKEITRRYSRLSLDGDSLIVSDQYRDYPIKDLSTGAREQIMLALRLGFASRILKQDRLFLILDDALQHTDWIKRELLVKKLAEIARGGWQVIYFSMDDHIKELFKMEGKSFKKGEFVFIELAS